MSQPDIEKRENHLAGLGFVFSGGLDKISRAEAQEAVQQRGGTVRGTVDQTTTHLVLGTTVLSKSKQEHARLLGVQIIDEAAFLRLLNP